ncbi:translation factor SUA5 [Pedococcus cremeus]|uniref:L-threonylcarbamoyladenylate synthase n=1 Tax=Pedococcus cremeus TaxID=587636 RepID=A0A1H9RG63_9MICO|nr:L-threonylcarbamoyladenylate synthase [Pedococcus cremeus]SER71692.1 translation factor SUA5 [Pedococcus cremeus]
MSPVYDCTSESGRAEGVAKAVEAVRGGEVVVIPTDTVYGIGADAFNQDAVAAVLAAKGRGRDMPPPVLVPNIRTVDGLATDVPAWARDLIKAFWPGPLTLVFKAQSSLMWDLGETNGTVALRMPQDDIALEVLAEVGPMAVTSANLTGQPAATTVTDAAAQLGAAVKVYLDGGQRAANIPSTIVDCTGERPEVLRVGALSEEQLDEVLATHFPPEADEPPYPTYTTGEDEPAAPTYTTGEDEPAAPTHTTGEDQPVTSPAEPAATAHVDTTGGTQPDGIQLPADSTRPAGEQQS